MTKNPPLDWDEPTCAATELEVSGLSSTRLRTSKPTTAGIFFFGTLLDFSSCFSFSASLSSDVFFLGAHVLSSRRTTTRGPLYRKCTISRVVSSIGLYKGPLMLTKCLHEMFTQQALTFVYGSVHSNSIMSGKPRAQKV